MTEHMTPKEIIKMEKLKKRHARQIECQAIKHSRKACRECNIRTKMNWEDCKEWRF